MDGIPLVRAFSWYLKPCESYSFLIKHAFNQLGVNKITDATLHPNVYLALKKYFNFEKKILHHRNYHQLFPFFDSKLFF